MTGGLPDRQTGKILSMTRNKRAASDISAFVTRQGLLLPKKISFDNWMGLGSYLSDIYSSSAWCLGDWLLYGEASFNGRYKDAITLTSLDYQTLRNHAWVARSFPMSRRRDTLSFTHHAEVAGLVEPEQDFWLRKAEENAWSAKRLRREVKTSMLERTNDNEPTPDRGQPGEGPAVLSPEDPVMLSVSIAADSIESCYEAASKLGLGVDAWAEQVLVTAAQKTLTPPANSNMG